MKCIECNHEIIKQGKKLFHVSGDSKINLIRVLHHADNCNCKIPKIKKWTFFPKKALNGLFGTGKAYSALKLCELFEVDTMKKVSAIKLNQKLFDKIKEEELILVHKLLETNDCDKIMEYKGSLTTLRKILKWLV